MSGKRSYVAYSGAPSVGYKQARMVGGRKLTYTPRAPVSGSFRSRNVPAGMVAAVRRAGEKKGMDTLLNVNAVVATTNTNDDAIVLNLIQMGSGSWNRIGRKVNLESVRLRGTATYVSAPALISGDLNSNTLRIVVVWDKQPSGAAIPTFDSIFGLTQQDGTESTTYLSPIKYDNMDRFSVLRDTTMSFSPQVWNNEAGTTDASRQECPFDEYVKLGGREVVFLGQTAPMTIADISTGALYVYFRANNATAGINQIAIDEDSFARLRYSDL